MAHQASRSNALLQLQIEQALADALLDSAAVTVRWNDPAADVKIEVAEDPNSRLEYPWNPADPGAESFFNRLEQDFSIDSSDQDLCDRANTFFAHLDTLFAAPTLETSLAQKFASVPQALLNSIARRAQRVATSSATLADQLIQCVQEALPQWSEEDLQVLVRPLAYSMRGEDVTAKSTDWSTLSEVEQAKLSLAIAQYALKELKQQ